MPVPELKKLQSISPVIGDSGPVRGPKEVARIRERLGEALSLKPYLWVPRVIHRTPLGDKGIDGTQKVLLTVHNGSPVGIQTLLPGTDPVKKPWIYTRFNAPFTRCSERIGLHQRLLRHMAQLGVKSEHWKIIKRIFKVGFQVPIRHLRKMVRSVVLSCHNNCCRSMPQPLGARRRPCQYPSYNGETNPIRKYGIVVPLWDRYSGFTPRASRP